MLGGSAISWFSRMQRETALSTVEAKYVKFVYVAVAGLGKKVMFLRQVQYTGDMSMLAGMEEHPITVFEDKCNGGAMEMPHSRVSCYRTKIIDEDNPSFGR